MIVLLSIKIFMSNVRACFTFSTYPPFQPTNSGPWFAEEYIRAKVTRHKNDEYELFTRVHTSKCVVTFVLR